MLFFVCLGSSGRNTQNVWLTLGENDMNLDGLSEPNKTNQTTGFFYIRSKLKILFVSCHMRIFFSQREQTPYPLCRHPKKPGCRRNQSSPVNTLLLVKR